MVQYNPKDWFTFIFKIHKADTVRRLFPILMGMVVYTFVIVFIVINIMHVPDAHTLKNLPVMHTLLGAVISLLLVFRTNTAYDRWWEGRKLWGSLVNGSRNFAMKLNVILPPQDMANRNLFKRLIPLFAFSLRSHLLANKTLNELFDKDEYQNLITHIDTTKHVPNQISGFIIKKVNELYIAKHITDAQLIILNEEMRTFADVCGACERIRNTPIPYSYSVFLKKFIFIYVMTLPFAFALPLHFAAIPVVVFIFYVLASLELIAEEIEDPFGDDTNDLPTDKIAQNIKKHVDEIFNSKY
jgi:ion channel-forming bestrophin family protein